MATDAVSGVAAPVGEFYSRRATGLVRLGTPWRILILNFANIGLTYIMFTYWAQPGVFPRSNLLVAIAVAAGLNLVFGLVLAIFTSAFPRSGGEYIYVSRTLHPAIGFSVSFAAATSQAFWTGVGGYWISTLVLSPIFSTFGGTTNNATLVHWGADFARPNYGFVIGTAFLVFVAILNLGGLRAYFRFQAINFVVAGIGLLFLFGVFLWSTHADFIKGLNDYVVGTGGPHNAYQKTLLASHTQGMPHGTTLKDTLGIFGIIFLVGIASTYVAGEVRTPRKTQLWGSVLGSLFYSSVVFLLALLMFKPVTQTFNNAAAWVNYNTDKYVLPNDPTFITWSGVLVHNSILLIIIAVSLVIWSYFWIPSAMIIATRAVFAWSLDRLVPRKLSEVNERTHSPVWAVISVAIVAELFLIAYWKNWFQFLTPFLAYTIVFLVTSIAGIVAGYRPSVRVLLAEAGWDKRYLGLPLISICGVVGVAYWGLALYYALTYDALALNTHKQLMLTAAQFLVPLVIFAGVYLWRKRSGVSLALAYKELPPE
jgi:basic amino acid/polyamine antiporter, APA family